MKYALEMGSSTTIYVPSFITTGSGVQKLVRGIYNQTDIQTHRQHGDNIVYFIF
jgi:hypothetical protein